MKFIPPLEISSKIMTLIVEARKELILVSPYVEIAKWDKMKRCLEKAVNRKVKMTFIARENAKQDLSFLEQLGVNLILIRNLHAKLYLNEKYGIVTSQNIVNYSDNNSIDIAYRTENENEKKELVDFVNHYIADTTPIHKNHINLVEQSDYENIFHIKEWELNKLIDFFVAKYSEIKFVPTSSYLFSSQLLSFADVMISSTYTIKFSKSTKHCDAMIEEISKINFEFKCSFRIDLKSKHEKFYYLDFIPTKRCAINNLIKDYERITDKIRASELIEELVKINRGNSNLV